MNRIRNFCIIAHIDHGKSTLADRMLEITWTIKKSDKNQVLDRMDLEQERWITIKLTPVRMKRKWYDFNLIDTPGHVDFQYEVSRSLTAVEWAILLVDASQGIQAQTLSVLYQAIEQGLEIIPVLNKIDLPAANPQRVAQELEKTIWVRADEIIAISWKTWLNVEKVLDAVIDRIQDPMTFKEQNPTKYLAKQESIWLMGEYDIGARALIFDSVYDSYKGVVCYVKVVEWELRPQQALHLVYSENEIMSTQVGHFSPEYVADETLTAWHIGYIVTWEKSVRDAQIGDTIISTPKKRLEYGRLRAIAIPGFKKVKPFVFAWVYPLETSDYDKLKEGLEKLSLNDSAVTYDYEHSHAMGHGFRCGFLGTLHMDIIKERLSREYTIDTIFTTPTVTYLIKAKILKDPRIVAWTNSKELIESGLCEYILTDTKRRTMAHEEIAAQYGEELKPRLAVKSWADMPEHGWIETILEPMVDVEIVWPEEYSGNIMWLAQEYRGRLVGMEYLDEIRVVRKYVLPMWELIVDFYDRLKSATRGYATMNYEFKWYEKNDLVRLDILINGEKIEAFSLIVHDDKAYYTWRHLVEKLKELIPRHLFSIPLQAWIGTKMIARENIPAIKKDVLAKCYGGDVSRKRKLLQKQKEWKKKMKAMGNVNVPNDIFIKMIAN
jgi:GTP-binding protein LepA